MKCICLIVSISVIHNSKVLTVLLQSLVLQVQVVVAGGEAVDVCDTTATRASSSWSSFRGSGGGGGAKRKGSSLVVGRILVVWIGVVGIGVVGVGIGVLQPATYNDV